MRIVALGQLNAAGRKTAVPTLFQRYSTFFHAALFVLGFSLIFVISWTALPRCWAQQNGFYLDLPLGGASTPTYLIAILAGLLWFLSPRVFPLGPVYTGTLSRQAFGGTAVLLF